jgi:outer membrane lipoprotein SlyB
VVGAATEDTVGASTGWDVVATILGDGLVAGAVSAFAIDTAVNKPPTATSAPAAPNMTDFFSMP